jgi:hypothetical protein
MQQHRFRRFRSPFHPSKSALNRRCFIYELLSFAKKGTAGNRVRLPKPVCSSAMASSTTQATVKRSDNFGNFVQLRSSASDGSDYVPGGGLIFNGTTVQVLSEQGAFCKVQVQVDASRTLVGFIKKQHLDFKIPAIQPRVPSPPAVQQLLIGGGGGGGGGGGEGGERGGARRSPADAAARVSKLPKATVAREDGGAAFVKLRQHPDAASSFVGPDIPNGSDVAIVEAGGAFTKVRFVSESGQSFEGYVKTPYLKLPSRIQMRWLALQAKYGCASASMDKLVYEIIGQDEVKIKILDIYESFKRDVELKETRANSLNAIFTGNPGTGACDMSACVQKRCLRAAALPLSILPFPCVSFPLQVKPALQNCGPVSFLNCKYVRAGCKIFFRHS